MVHRPALIRLSGTTNMHYVIAANEPFQFNVGGGVVYSFDTEEPTAISDAHYQTIVERIGSIHLKEVDAPKEEAPAPQE